MKAIKILFLSVFLIFLVNTASAVVVYGEWNDNQAQSISIDDGDSVDFSAFFGTIAPPMTISVKLYSGSDLIHTFVDTSVNQKSFAQTYTVNQAIYSHPGNYEVKISGSDSYGDMSTTLSLTVINYPPEIISTPITEVNEGESYSYDVEATDPDNHPLTYSLDGPGWLSINSQTGLITGIAPDVTHNTDFDVEVIVSDGIDTDTQSYTLTVIWIPDPSLSQTLGLVDYVNVDYHATLSELDSAILNIYYGTDLIATRNINTPSYHEIFDFYDIHGITKGDYSFVLEAVGYSISETDEINIPDYVPEVVPLPDENFNEENSIDITLPAPTDKNPEDEPVPYLSSVSLDGKTTTEINDNVLIITGNRDATGNYQIELEFGQGVTGTEILNGYIDNLIDISGVLENNEDDTGIQGVIRVYDNDQSPLEINQIYEGNDVSLGKIETTDNGIFSFQINERPSDLDEIILQARIGTADNYQGYVRTITLDSDDSAGVLVRAVPYAPYESDPALFRQFMSELCSDQPNTRFDFYAEYIRDGEFDPEAWPQLVNYTGLIGIEILSENPFGAENGTFTTAQQNNIKNKILDVNDINGIIGNYSISENQVFIVKGGEGHFIFYEQEINPKGKVLADPGWIIVVPYKNMPYTGLAEPRMAPPLVYGGTVYLQPNTGSGGTTISHEFGHIFIASGHPISMPPDQTVMSYLTTLSTTGPADKKAGKLIYEQTYMTFPLVLFPSVDNLYNILGLGFYGESQISGTIDENYFEPEDDGDYFTDGKSNSNDNDIINSNENLSNDNSNTNIPHDDTIYLQSNIEKRNILTSLSDIIKQVISFIKSVFSI